MTFLLDFLLEGVDTRESSRVKKPLQWDGGFHEGMWHSTNRRDGHSKNE